MSEMDCLQKITNVPITIKLRAKTDNDSGPSTILSLTRSYVVIFLWLPLKSENVSRSLKCIIFFRTEAEMRKNYVDMTSLRHADRKKNNNERSVQRF